MRVNRLINYSLSELVILMILHSYVSLVTVMDRNLSIKHTNHSLTSLSISIPFHSLIADMNSLPILITNPLSGDLSL